MVGDGDRKPYTLELPNQDVFKVYTGVFQNSVTFWQGKDYRVLGSILGSDIYGNPYTLVVGNAGTLQKRVRCMANCLCSSS